MRPGSKQIKSVCFLSAMASLREPLFGEHLQKWQDLFSFYAHYIHYMLLRIGRFGLQRLWEYLHGFKTLHFAWQLLLALAGPFNSMIGRTGCIYTGHIVTSTRQSEADLPGCELHWFDTSAFKKTSFCQRWPLLTIQAHAQKTEEHFYLNISCNMIVYDIDIHVCIYSISCHSARLALIISVLRYMVEIFDRQLQDIRASGPCAPSVSLSWHGSLSKSCQKKLKKLKFHIVRGLQYTLCVTVLVPPKSSAILLMSLVIHFQKL